MESRELGEGSRDRHDEPEMRADRGALRPSPTSAVDLGRRLTRRAQVREQPFGAYLVTTTRSKTLPQSLRIRNYGRRMDLTRVNRMFRRTLEGDVDA